MASAEDAGDHITFLPTLGAFGQTRRTDGGRICSLDDGCAKRSASAPSCFDRGPQPDQKAGGGGKPRC